MESKVKLQSSDNVEFEVDLSVVQDSRLVMNTIEDTGMESTIFLPNVSRNILAKVINYCEYHVKSKQSTDEKPVVPEDEIRQWDVAFVDIDDATLLGLINAANYLDMKNLLNLMCQKVVDMITDKTPEEIRRTFGIVNDFTPEEEEKHRRENEWFFSQI